MLASLFTRQLNYKANYEFQTKVLQCLLNVYFLASVRQNLDFVHKRSLVLTWPLFHFLCTSSLPNPKQQPFCFIKCSSLSFGFHSLGNEMNF